MLLGEFYENILAVILKSFCKENKTIYYYSVQKVTSTRGKLFLNISAIFELANLLEINCKRVSGVRLSSASELLLSKQIQPDRKWKETEVAANVSHLTFYEQCSNNAVLL